MTQLRDRLQNSDEPPQHVSCSNMNQEQFACYPDRRGCSLCVISFLLQACAIRLVHPVPALAAAMPLLSSNETCPLLKLTVAMIEGPLCQHSSCRWWPVYSVCPALCMHVAAAQCRPCKTCLLTLSRRVCAWTCRAARHSNTSPSTALAFCVTLKIE